jgi:7-cyano-7-deazaguanine synthase
VVHSGGADSTICLHWALDQFNKVSAITFDYGQRHRNELLAAQKICQQLNIPQKVLPISSIPALGGNALVDNNLAIEEQEDQLPSTFVPGRNLIFLTLAAAWAYQLKAKHLVTGVCQTDFSGYPDCRQSTIQSLEQTLRHGIDEPFKIHCPLMFLSKAQSIELAQTLEGCLESLAHSHTCYEGQYPPCGVCPSCQLRAKGFAEVGIADPLLTRQD